MNFSKIISLLLFVFGLSLVNETFAATDRTSIKEGIEIGKDTYKGKRKRNNPSRASKSSFARQSKHVKKSVKRNDKRNKKMLKHRSKKQKRQGRFSRKDTFR